MFIRFKQQAEVIVSPRKPDKPVAFEPGDEADLFPGVAERLVNEGVAEKIERPAGPHPPAPSPDGEGEETRPRARRKGRE